MTTFRLAFVGTKIGAIGITGFQVFDLQADSQSTHIEVARKAYDTHEHITGSIVVHNLETGVKTLERP